MKPLSNAECVALAHKVYQSNRSLSYHMGDYIDMQRWVKVDNIQQLIEAAEEKKAVYVKAWDRHSPASFFFNWKLKMVLSWIESDQFYIILK